MGAHPHAVLPPPRCVTTTLTMETMGSISLSLGTSIQVISVAPGSPGEHGVRRSSTMTPGVVREGPRTYGTA